MQQTRRLTPIANCTITLHPESTLRSYTITRYYEGGVSSVYLWDLEDGGFAGVVLLKKSILLRSVILVDLFELIVIAAMTPASPNEPSGLWDSIHVFEASERGRQAHYKLTSTIMLHLLTRKESEGEDKQHGEMKGIEGLKRQGEVSLSGSMTRQVNSSLFVARELMDMGAFQTEQDCPLHDMTSHISNTGRMIEDMEIKMRNLLQEVSFINFMGRCDLTCEIGVFRQNKRHRI